VAADLVDWLRLHKRTTLLPPKYSGSSTTNAVPEMVEILSFHLKITCLKSHVGSTVAWHASRFRD